MWNPPKVHLVIHKKSVFCENVCHLEPFWCGYLEHSEDGVVSFSPGQVTFDFFCELLKRQRKEREKQHALDFFFFFLEKLLWNQAFQTANNPIKILQNPGGSDEL